MKMLKKNIGDLDRNVRIALGAILLLVGLLAPLGMFWRILLLIVAAIALITAFTGFCPLLQALGFNTNKKGEEKHPVHPPHEEPSR